MSTGADLVQQFVDVLRVAAIVGFVALTAHSGWRWLMHKERQRFYLFLFFLSLIVLSGSAWVDSFTHYQTELGPLTVTSFLIVPAALLFLRHSFIPVSRGLRIGVALMSISLLVLAHLFEVGSDPAHPGGQLQQRLALVNVMFWIAVVAETAIRFWLGGRQRPLVQRARLRAMGYACSLMILTVIASVAGVAVRETLFGQLVSAGLGLLTVPALFLSFSPPTWVRRAWREPEEERLRRGTVDLLRMDSDVRVVAERTLSWALRLVGAECGFIRSAGGELLGAQGMNQEEVDNLMVILDRATPARGVPWVHKRRVVTVPLVGERGAGLLVVVSGPLSPLLGSDEVERLTQFSAAIAMALDRADLTRELADQTALYQTMLEALSQLGEGFVMLDSEVRPTFANRAYLALTGYSMDELRQLASVSELVAPDRLDEWLARAEARRNGEAVSEYLETRLRTKQGRNIDVEVASMELPGAGDAPTRFFAVVRDISERKRAEERELQRTLELARSNAALEEFAYAASHDLQEPLRMVSSYVDLLQKRYGNSLDDQARQFMHFASDGAHRMQVLIRDLLGYSRVSSRPNQITEISAEEALEAAMAALRGTIEETAARVEHEPLPKVQADAGQLTQLFQNLIHNALKFHDQRSPLVRISAARGDGEWLFTVSDNGIGIGEANRERVFQVFQRLHTREEYSGTGIGLSLCRKIVERHGGRIWVESRLGEGSAFHFTLPIRDGFGEPAPSAPQATQSASA